MALRNRELHARNDNDGTNNRFHSTWVEFCDRCLLSFVGCVILSVSGIMDNGDRAFAVAGPHVWNSLPPAIRDPSLSLSIFGKLLKIYLFV